MIKYELWLFICKLGKLYWLVAIYCTLGKFRGTKFHKFRNFAKASREFILGELLKFYWAYYMI